MNQTFILFAAVMGLLISPYDLAAQIDRDAARYVQAINKINEDHARNPGKEVEETLSKKLPPDARSALQRVLQSKPNPTLAAALRQCADASVDLDLVADFDAVRQRLEAVSPEEARKAGRIVSRKRFIVRGIGEFADGYL